MDDAGSGALMCTYSVPIHDHTGRKVGVFGADISLDWLHGQLRAIDKAENAQRKMFGKDRIKEVLQMTSPDPHTLIEQMTQTVTDFVGDTEQSDDLTMLALQYV